MLGAAKQGAAVLEAHVDLTKRASENYAKNSSGVRTVVKLERI
jgi:hypothetical protein